MTYLAALQPVIQVHVLHSTVWVLPHLFFLTFHFIENYRKVENNSKNCILYLDAPVAYFMHNCFIFALSFC